MKRGSAELHDTLAALSAVCMFLLIILIVVACSSFPHQSNVPVLSLDHGESIVYNLIWHRVTSPAEGIQVWVACFLTGGETSCVAVSKP